MLEGQVRVRPAGNYILPDQVAVAKAHEAFHPDGTLKDAKHQEAVRGVGVKVAEVLKKLAG